MKNNIGILVILFAINNFLFSQADYFGAGNDQNITISSSSNFSSGDAYNTVNGNGLIAEYADASRFLSQSTMGVDNAEILRLMDVGKEQWLQNEFDKPQSLILEEMLWIWDEILDSYLSSGVPEEDIYGPWGLHFNYAWWQRTMTQNDNLRQRITFALSQIFVVSMQSDLIEFGEGVSHYYDLLGKHAFGNFRDLLLDVSLNPCMGYYLTHLNNPRSFPNDNIHPDENFARELMQLFTIGIYELNLDGTRKLDANGNFIPTYDNNDIKELAKVFTGLGGGGIQDFVDWTDAPYFGLDIYALDRTVPMKMYHYYHDKGPKDLLNGYRVPADQDPMEDVEDAIDHLFNHDNVAPFISKQLIQRLIKSNPSPAYVQRVARVFNNNGSGVRGDMKSLIEAILLDEEARSCESMLEPENGKLREPLLRQTQVLKAIPLISPWERYWNASFDYYERTGQIAMYSPSVFNFYLPDYSPVGELAEKGLVAPEFNLHNSKTSIGYMNYAFAWMFWDLPMYSWEEEYGDPNICFEFEYFRDYWSNIDNLLNHMDLVFAHGQMTDRTKNLIRDEVLELNWGNENRTKLMLYLILVSPDYNIFK